MGIPAPRGDGETPADPVFRVAASLVGAVARALRDASWEGDVLVSHGPAGIPLGTPCGADQLAVWATSIEGARLSLAMRLSVDCWPVVEGGSAIRYPSASDQQDAAAWLYFWRCVANGALHVWSKRDATVKIGPSVPAEPSGGAAGWLWQPITMSVTSTLVAASDAGEW